MRWKTAGNIKETKDAVKLPTNAINSAKCGMEIAGRSVRKLVKTRIPINQTISGILNENDSAETDSSIVCIIEITRNGYENSTFTIKTPFTILRRIPMGRLLTITSWIFELKDKKAQTEKPTLRIATAMNDSVSIARNWDLSFILASTTGKMG